ncbi:ATP-binding protein [Ramlibacter sp.]|uniref:ATP-binding protein n=1 Tax=Ramlibacter sp. TaxID=1917967 RepID=UPI002CC81479|nr:ATP-binding protein [Ramlibacter sp.]HWI83076.1 ATP-binding protein [Ramlibacter sp.]
MPDRPLPPLDLDRHYRQIVQSAIDYAIVGCDTDGRVTSWNEGARRVLGWSEQDMLGQTVHRFFTPEDNASGTVEREMAQARRAGRAADERWHLRAGGERFWASGELMPLRDEGGAITGFVKILRDRTEQRVGEARLRELTATLQASEQRLQLALDVGGMGVWQVNLQTREVVWWPGMAEIHGLPAGAAPPAADGYARLIHPEDRDRVLQAMRDTIAQRRSQHIEYRVLWPDGSCHWIEARSRLFCDAQGAAWAVAGVCLDITPRKRVEGDLRFLARASAELAGLTDYQSTLDRIAHLAVPEFADWCMVDILGEDGALERVAVAHSDPAKEQLARDLHRRFPPDPGRIAGAGPMNVLRTGQPERIREITGELLDRAVAQTDYLAMLRAMGVRSYIGVPLAVRGKVLGAITFVTGESHRLYRRGDLALAEELGRRAAVALENAMLLRALQESDRAKDVFLATLAHELRNPLAPVWNGLTIITRAPHDSQRVLQVAGMIERQVGQLARLVDDLLDVSRISTGKIELKKQPADLAAILHSAIETSRPHIESARHGLSLEVPREPLEVEGDPVRLAQVFANLLNNASKYTRPGGRIDVVVHAEPEWLVVRVRDTGEGIAPDMLAKVFGLFTQVTHPAERHQGGLGIGLSLVEGLVRLHGGTVEAHSAGLGQGSEFVVRLPRRPVPEQQEQRHGHEQTRPQPLAADSPAAHRILVVDDNVDAAATLAELLRMMGWEVAVANDGLSALEAVAAHSPEIVLLDIGLPDITGYEVARRIRAGAGSRQPRLVALTGWGQEQDKRMAAQAGFDEHWTKPVDPTRLQHLGRA